MEIKYEQLPIYKMAKEVADKAMDEFEIDGKTLRQWIKEVEEYYIKKEQGKIIELPCKPGDTVWIIYQTIVDKLIGEYSILKGFIQELAIENSNNLRIKVDTPYGVMCFDKYDMGKTVFLTEEEAMEALEGMKK